MVFFSGKFWNNFYLNETPHEKFSEFVIVAQYRLCVALFFEFLPLLLFYSLWVGAFFCFFALVIAKKNRKRRKHKVCL